MPDMADANILQAPHLRVRHQTHPLSESDSEIVANSSEINAAHLPSSICSCHKQPCMERLESGTQAQGTRHA